MTDPRDETMGRVLTVVVYFALAVVVVTALVALAVLVLPATEQLAPAPPDRTPWALPAQRPMTTDDVSRLKLPVTLRGYRFAETDAVLDRLGEEIAHRDAVIATLQAQLAGGEAGERLATEATDPAGDDRSARPDDDAPTPAAEPLQPVDSTVVGLDDDLDEQLALALQADEPVADNATPGDRPDDGAPASRS